MSSPSSSPWSLSDAQRRLLEQRLRGQTGAPSDGAIQRAPRDRPLPLSFGQERLWLLHHLEPGVSVYNSGYLYHLRGPLDVAALERALQTIVQRHESLRTSIAVVGDTAHQVIRPPSGPALPVTAVASVAEAAERARHEIAAPFDLARDLLLRPHLYRLGADEHVFLITAHHSAWDAWSTQVFWSELRTLYDAFIAGRPDPLPALPVQYADFASWQRQRLQGDRHARLLEFWRGHLADAAPLDLPADRPRPSALTYAGDALEFGWSRELREALESLARSEGATLFMLLLAGWSTLLHRLSGQDTVVTGTAVAGRARRELDPLIGFFVNTLALRVDCGGDPSFRALLRRIRERTTAAYDHDELPFEKLVADLRVPRDPSRHPLFQTALVLHSAPPPTPVLAGLEIRPLPRVRTGARFDLALTATAGADGLSGLLEYSTELFDTATVRRWLGHLETLLRAAVAAPDTPITALPLLSSEERASLLRDLAGGPAPYPRDVTVHELFRAQATRTPGAIALVEGDDELTYAELDARSDRLAAKLMAMMPAAGDTAGDQTSGPGDAGGRRNVRPVCVAIELERSIGFVVSVLAVLKAGAAYVPLLRDLPPPRRKFILEDTRPVALISAGAPAGPVPDGVHVIALDAADAVAGVNPAPPSAPPVASTDAAYVMYTSGSTGQPKGVVLPHRGIVRLVHGQTPPPFHAGDRFLLLASTAFDASTFELWAPLLNGGTCVIFGERWPEFDTLAEAVQRHRITHLFLTAGLFNQVVEHRPDILRGVRHLFTGGEAMSARHAAQVRAVWPDLRVTNCYGPTEITTYTISHDLRRDERWPQGNVPIGRPVPNARAYILDRRGEPVPVGVPGELFLGGDGLALGYLGRPDLTAERFVADPFTLVDSREREPAGARMYRTGDLARWRADGTIEFLGRSDDQVKIRGFRVEPGEIENVLREHEDVRDVAVIAHADPPGGIRLVAYLVLRAEPSPQDAARLRSFASARLPDYMVPAAFVFLPQLPLTPNGKLDRRALPPPDDGTAETGDAAAVPPRTSTEEAIARVWCELLARTSVGVHDNFFALGGHSLLAMQGTARLGTRLACDVPLRWWFEHPTIAGLAARIDRERSETVEAAIPPADRGRELPLSHEEQRLWFLHHALPDPATYHVAWGQRLRGPLDRERLQRALARVMERHEILRTGYVDREGRPVRRITLNPAVPFTLLDPERPEGAGADLVVQRHLASAVREPFRLDAPPLWRVLCLRLAPDDHLLVFTVHHLICDEWSLPIWRAELAAAYELSSDDEPSPLPVQYADYAVWQRQRVASPLLDADRAFWSRQLAGASPLLVLPEMRLSPVKPTGAGRRLEFSLPRTAVEALEQLARSAGATPFMAWLTLYGGLLARASAQFDLVIGIPFAQRRRPELQPLIGFFLNTLPVRLRMRPGIRFRELLADVRAMVQDAFAHGELPLDEIAAQHGGARTGRGSALFNVMFAVLDDAPAEPAWPGLETETVELGTDTAKADLTLFIAASSAREPRGTFEFSLDVMNPSTIGDLADDFLQLLNAVAADPDTIVLDPAMRPAPPAVERTPAPAVVPPPPAGTGELERELATIWGRVLHRENVRPDDDFFAIGGHSLLALQLVHEIRQQLGRSVTLAQLLATPTVAGLSAALRGGADTATAARPWKGSGPGTPFFYVPGMNGVEFLPDAVAQRLSADRRWFDALQHPGADGREPPASSIPDIASELVRQVRAVQPVGPYLLGGFCHGGLVAFEVARQLEAAGERVAGLVMWDTFPYRGWRWRTPGEILRFLQRRLSRPGAGTFVADRGRFLWHRLVLAAQVCWRGVRIWLPGRAGRVEARMVNAGMRARRLYTPMTLRAPVLLARSRDERVLVERLPQDGWAEAIRGPCQVVDLPHWHFHLLREPAISELAERTAAFLCDVDPAR